MELAERLGMTKRELLGRMSSREITEWKVLWTIRAQESKAARSGGSRRRMR
jgi:hypothetical protein